MATIYGSQNKLMRVRDMNYLMASENLAITDHTYAELKALKEAGQLKTGTSYRMTNFQTIHNIYNTDNKALNVQGVSYATSAYTEGMNTDFEPIILTPTSINEFHMEVKSELYPNDVIYLDFNNSVCEDGITPRKGLITFRKCTILNVETHYDWRNVKFRRWAVTAATWTSGTSYASGAIVEYNDYMYQSKIASNTGTPALNNYEWKPVYHLWHTKSAAHYEGIGIIREHVATSPTGFKIMDIAVGVDPNNFLDYWTFNWVQSGQSGNTYHTYINAGKDHDYVVPAVKNVRINKDQTTNRNNNIVFVNQTLHFGNKPLIHTMTFDDNCSNFTFGARHENVDYPRNSTNNIIKAGHQYCTFSTYFSNNCVASAYWNNYGVGFEKCGFFAMFRVNNFSSAFAVENTLYRGTFQYNSVNAKMSGCDINHMQSCSINERMENVILKGVFNPVTVNTALYNVTFTGSYANKNINLRSDGGKYFHQAVDESGVTSCQQIT